VHLPRRIAGALDLSRHEAFAQGVAAGLSATKAYQLAYGRRGDGATRASAARLLANVSVQGRIIELRAAAAAEAKASLARLIPLLEARGRATIEGGDLRGGIKILERLAQIAEAS
jgi:phage terminase small subunit